MNIRIKSGSDKRLWYLLVLLLMVLISGSFIWDAIFRPILFSNPAKHREAQCMSNLREIGKSLSMYAKDWDETLPPPQIWSSCATNYLISTNPAKTFVCPSSRSKFGYCFNDKIGAVRAGEFTNPNATVMVFECETNSPNTFGGHALLPLIPRHAGTNNYLMINGYVTRSNIYSIFQWEPH